MVQGGFQSWIKQGLRVKELKPETALSIFNEVFFKPLLFIRIFTNFVSLSNQK